MSSEVGRRFVGATVGHSPPKLENLEKALGRAEYIADLYRPNMVHAAALGSPHAHARILRYDVSKALSAEGVVAVITGGDLGEGRMGAFIKDEHALAKDKVLHVGEPVAAVAAETEAQARVACLLIEVEYEPLEAVLSPLEGLADGAPILHEKLKDYFKVFDAGSQGNIASRTRLECGDVDAAWAQCDVIVEGEFTTQAQAHVSIEPCGALAESDANGRVTLWSANQPVFRVQANVCESLGLPMSRLRCLTPRVGAGFGNKMEPHIQPIAVALALKCGRPVKMILSREEDFEIVRARHPFRIRMRTGAKKDGTLIARECEVWLDCAAYADDSPGVLGYALMMASGPYRIPHVRNHGRLVYTNKLRFGAFRGFGNPQVTFAGEQQIDEIAGRLGLDPFEIRRGNILREGEPWFVGAQIASNGLAECLDAVEAARSGPAAPGKRRGYGLAVTAHISGLLAGRVGIIGSNTDLPFGAVSARAHWAVGGPIVGTKTLVFEQATADPKRAVAVGLPFPRIGVFSSATLVVDVEVDEATGQTRVIEAWTAADVGRAINPLLVKLQLEGGFVQGMGYALYEEMVWDGPRLANPSLMDCKVPTSLDAPHAIHAIVVEHPEPDGTRRFLPVRASGQGTRTEGALHLHDGRPDFRRVPEGLRRQRQQCRHDRSLVEEQSGLGQGQAVLRRLSRQVPRGA